MRYKERDEFVESLEAYLDYLKNDPRALEAPAPYRIYVTSYVYEYTKDENGGSVVDNDATRGKMRKIAKALAPCEKTYTGYNFQLKRSFGKKLTVEVNTSRENICTKRVVGTKEVPAQMIEARTEEIIEWDCNDPLLAS